MNILMIDDVEGPTSVSTIVREMGHQVTTTEGSPTGLSSVSTQDYDVAFWRLPLNGSSAFNVLGLIEHAHPDVPLISFAMPDRDVDLTAFISRLVDLVGTSITTRHHESDSPSIRPGTRVSLEALEREHIKRIVSGTKSLAEAASVLGIDAATLYRKRKRYEIPA